MEVLETDGAAAVTHHLKNLTIKDPDLYKDRAPKTSDFRWQLIVNTQYSDGLIHTLMKKVVLSEEKANTKTLTFLRA